MATQPLNLDMKRDRERDREMLRRVTPPERQRRLSEQSQTKGTSTPESRLAPDGHHPSSEDAARPLHDSVISEDGEGDLAESVNGLRPMSPRRGIWEWARAGRLTMMGRQPHSEWKVSATARSLADLVEEGTPEHGAIFEPRDDFSVPSSITSQTLNGDAQAEVDAARMEGMGIPHVISPSFAQTKHSSDDLVAASSTSSTPADRMAQSEDWSFGELSTPSVAASKQSRPSTPDTPTPQQRRRDTMTASDTGGTPTHPAPSKGPPSRSGESKPDSDEQQSDASSTKTATKTTPKPASKTPSQRSSSPHHIPTYKIALAPNLMPQARSEVAST